MKSEAKSEAVELIRKIFHWLFDEPVWGGEFLEQMRIIHTAPGDVNQAIASGVPFSLCCIECDAGTDVGSPMQATVQGWKQLQPDDGHSYNFSGICPECESLNDQ